MMHREGFNEERTRKISLFAHLCALRDNCVLLGNEYSKLFVGLLLFVKILCEHIRSMVWPLAALKVQRFLKIIVTRDI